MHSYTLSVDEEDGERENKRQIELNHPLARTHTNRQNKYRSSIGMTDERSKKIFIRVGMKMTQKSSLDDP